MKKLTWLLAFAVPVVMISCQKDVSNTPEDEIATVTTGNGAQSGKHYTLNIIGVDKPKNFNYDESGESYTQGNGHVIFVDLVGRTKILLREGDFEVLDANGTDGTASFQLPEPDAGDDGNTDYCIFVRGLGKPNGEAFITTCFWDQQTSTEFCNTGTNIVEVSAHGNNNKFQNVTTDLLYIWADVDGDGDLDRTELFSDSLDEYYWYYDNNKLRIAQLRFYPDCSVAVPVDPEPAQ